MNKGTPADPLRDLLRRCLPIIEADARMMADITRHSPLDAEAQAIHDSTEYESEKLAREIPAALATKPAEQPAPTLTGVIYHNDKWWVRWDQVAGAVQPPAPEPVAWMWQHAETGMAGFVEHASPEDLAHFERMNRPRKIICPLYASPSIAQRGAPEPNNLRDAVLGLLRRWEKDDDYDLDTCIRNLRDVLAQRGAALTDERAAALEEAAKACEAMDDKYEQPRPRDCAAAIRALSPERPEPPAPSTTGEKP